MKKNFLCLFMAVITICFSSCSNLNKIRDDLTGSSSGSSDSSLSQSSGQNDIFGDVDDLSSILSGLDSSSNLSSDSDMSSSSGTTSQNSSNSSQESSSSSSSQSSSSNSSTSSESTPSPGSKVTNYENMKAVWISYLEFNGFKSSNKQTFTANVQRMFSKSKNIGLNTVIVQIRPFGDSFYNSQFYPWSKYVTGTVGKSVDFDPVQIMVDEAHKLGLSIHAWINPYRIMTDAELKLVESKYKIKQWHTGSNNNYMVSVDGRWWLKPGNKEVQNLIVGGAKEIMIKYNVDGLHIDDYFYGTDIAVYGDTKAQAQANTTAMVKGLYDMVKSVDKNKWFGVSPAGGFKFSVPDSDTKHLSTDLVKWCKNPGYIDYVMPQIYWDYDHSVAPFTPVFNNWERFVTCDSVRLFPGLAPYRLPHASIYKQIGDITKSSKAKGYALYRYDNIVDMKFN